jgi:RHS repeat-associated protein
VNDSSWWNYPAKIASATSYAANTLNQYTAVGSAHPTYDGNGDLTNDGHFTYCYDPESRLTSVLSVGTCAAPTTTVAAYAYDAQGRRKSKTVGATTTNYVTDDDNREVLEYNGTSGALQTWYAFGLGPDEALNQINVAATPNTRATLIPDVIGSIIGSLDSGGTLTKFGYQTFGENPSLTSGGYRYTGRRLDPETVAASFQPSGLYYYRARTYSPTWGRFLQPDPSGYPAGANLYAYTDNDPLNQTDPSGNCPAWIPAVIGGVIGGVGGAIVGYHATGTLKGTLIGAGTGAAAGVAAAYGGAFIVSTGAALGTGVGATIGGAAGASAGVGVGSSVGVVVSGATAGAGGTALTESAINTLAGGNLDVATDVKTGAIVGAFAAFLPEAAAVGYARGIGLQIGAVGENTLSTVSGVTGFLGGVATTCSTSTGCGPKK